MRRILFAASLWIFLLFIIGCNNYSTTKTKSDYIIQKENGRIILAYKAFEDFLDSDKSWDSYRQILLDAYPEMIDVHNKQAGWGAIDTIKFKEEVQNFRKEYLNYYFNRYTEKSVNKLYDSIIGKAHHILKPLSNNPVDLCLFLPYGSCFIMPREDRSTIYISLFIDTADVQKIMAHEYAHNLHMQRRPDEPMTLKRELVSEGMAVYLTIQILKGIELNNAIPFMPESAVEWCSKNEQLIKDAIQPELNDTSNSFIVKYIADGSFANPPEGFVEKTAYYAGFRIIESCIEKGMSLEEICALDSKAVIEKSKYFNYNPLHDLIIP